MGGTIGFTLRRPNGKEYRMSRWTNWTPWAIDNIRLVNKEEGHIRAIVRDWVKARKHPEKEWHWTYNYPYLAPAEYGLVVVDYQKNKILDCNHYHQFAQISGILLKNEVNATRIDNTGYTLGGDGEEMGLKAFFSKEGNEAARFYDFYKAERIKAVEQWSPEKEEWELVDDVNNWSLRKIVTELICVDNAWTNFHLDMSPFEVVKFKEGAEGFTQFRQAVLDLGFELTKEEEKIWDERISRYGDNDD